jgi:hypothetical protein
VRFVRHSFINRTRCAWDPRAAERARAAAQQRQKYPGAARCCCWSQSPLARNMEPEPEPEASLGPICVPALSYSGNFVVVTAATSPYADPGRFVEEGIQPDAEYLTNYPHLDVLTELNPRRFVVYKPVARAGPQPPGQVTSSSAPTAIKDLTMQVVTPNRHTETMIAIERALLRLHGTQRQSPHAIVGGLRMQSVTVKRGLPGAAGCHSPSGAVYTEVLQETHADTAPRATNVWMHVTHCAGKDIQFQTPAQKFGFDLADVRHHPSGEDRADIIAPGVPWVASDSDLSRPLDGPSRSAKFPAHSRRFLDHVKRNSDVVAEHTVMHGSIDLEPVSPRRIEAQRQLKETYSAGTAGTPPNLRLWDVKVHLDPQKAELSCSGYFMGTLIYRHCQHHLLELDYGAFAIAPADPGDMDACMWKLVERLDGEIAGLENKQVLIIPLDDTAGPFLQTGIHTWINMCRTEKASRVAAGALLRVTRDIWHDKRPSFQYGFVLAKPPSHHSLPNEHFVHYKGRYDVDGLPPSLRASLQAGQVLPSGYCHFNSVVCSQFAHQHWQHWTCSTSPQKGGYLGHRCASG